MLRSRIIACLLVDNGRLVKTTRFADPKYVGDPINAVRIFNEKEVDELFVADISAAREQRDPDYELIRNLAAECRMPFAYAGGVKTVEQIEQIISLGVEKVALSSAIIHSQRLVEDAVKRVGSQSVVAVMDVRKAGLLRRYEVFIHNGLRGTGSNPVELAKALESAGVGEIVVSAIERDGEMKGYDHDLIDQVRNAVSLPLTALGGAGSLDDLSDLIQRHEIIGAAAGSLFVFKGKYRAVLINYPNRYEKEAVLRSAKMNS
jgi:imidazole glycerol-phosphate synthase subunit HisF